MTGDVPLSLSLLLSGCPQCHSHEFTYTLSTCLMFFLFVHVLEEVSVTPYCRCYRLLPEESFYAYTPFKQFCFKYGLCYSSIHVLGIVNDHHSFNTWLLNRASAVAKHMVAVSTNLLVCIHHKIYWDFISLLSILLQLNRETHTLESFWLC